MASNQNTSNNDSQEETTNRNCHISSLVHLPALTTKHKFDNMSGYWDGIHPGEEDEFMDKVSKIPCFLVKGWAAPKPEPQWLMHALSRQGRENETSFNGISVQDLKDCRVRIKVKPEWRELQKEYISKHQIDVNSDFTSCKKFFLQDKSFRSSDQVIRDCRNEVNHEIDEKLENLLLSHIQLSTEGKFPVILKSQQERSDDTAQQFEKGCFPMKNNHGATYKYGDMLIGHSTYSLKMFDDTVGRNEEGSIIDLYLNFHGYRERNKNTPPYFRHRLNFQQDEICFLLECIYWSVDKHCALYKPFYE